MVRFLIILFSLSLFTTCSTDRSVTLILSGEHSWVSVSGRPLWHKVVYTDGSSLSEFPLSVGVKELRLLIPSGSSVIFTAYPLGSLAPLGGAIQGDEEGGTVVLTPEEGMLCNYLQRINRDWSPVVKSLNYHKVVEDIGRAPRVHYPSLMQMIITGAYDGDSIPEAEVFSHTLDSIPSGRYWLDGYEELSFYKGDYQEAQLPPLSSGVHSFLNHEHLLVLDLIVSDEEDVAPTYAISPADIIFTISQSDYHAME